MRPGTRGSSILEILVASALLLVALMGIVALLLRASQADRDGMTAMNASLYAQESVAQYGALGFDGLSAGVFDGGDVFDSTGRRYGRIVNVIDATDDGGYNSFEVQVTVEYDSSLPPPFKSVLRTNASLVVSLIPDSGL